MLTRNKLKLMFFVKRAKRLKNGKVPIYVRITLNGSRSDVSVGENIEEHLWETSTGRATGKSRDSKLLNEYLASVERSIHENFIDLLGKNEFVTSVKLKNAWLGKPEEGKTLMNELKEHNERARLLIGKEYTAGTVQKFDTTYRHLLDYLDVYKNESDIQLSNVDYDFVSGFDLYLKKNRNCEQNTAVKYLKVLKKVLRIARAQGAIQHDPFLNFKLHVKKVSRDFLTEEELSTIQRKSFSIKRLEEVKDIFLFACFTGLAYVDLRKLTQHNIVIGTDGNRWIKIERTKTKTLSSIPLLQVSCDIINKYKNDLYCIKKGILLPVHSNQKMNAYLKEIADLCGIHKNLTCHIARHTFATTVTLNNNVPIETVSKMLGHSSIKITKIYAKLLDKKVGEDMQHLRNKYSNI